MSAYHLFVSPRTTAPDGPSLLAQLRAIDASIGYAVRDVGYLVKKATEFSAADLSACQTAIDTAPAATVELQAQSWVDAMPLTEKAVLLTLLDQINVLRGKVGLGAVSAAQAIQAVRDKAGTL